MYSECFSFVVCCAFWRPPLRLLSQLNGMTAIHEDEPLVSPHEVAQLSFVAMEVNVSSARAWVLRSQPPFTDALRLHPHISTAVREESWGPRGRKRSKRGRKRSRVPGEPSLILPLTPRRSRCDADTRTFAHISYNIHKQNTSSETRLRHLKWTSYFMLSTYTLL